MQVTIRPLREEDAFTSVKWRNDPEVFKYTGNTYNHEITIESELQWIRNVITRNNEYRCAIIADNVYVGNIYLIGMTTESAEYHIFIGDRQFWGKGVAKRASAIILDYAFNIFGLKRLTLEVNSQNTRAMHLYHALGFTANRQDGDRCNMVLNNPRTQKTECARILEESILPLDFFKEETICDFFVDLKRKKIWAVSLDILIVFDRICRKHNIKYFLAFGSLLGAVRHQGFIPWDDDMDVCMTRVEYEKFIRIADGELTEPYSLQIPGREKDYYFTTTKIRNANTSGISRNYRYSDFNMGIALDIFVLDNCLITNIGQEYRETKELILMNTANMRRKNPFPNVDDIQRINSYEMTDPDDIMKKMYSIAKKHMNETTDHCYVSMLTVYPPEKLTYKKDSVNEIVETTMYGHSFLIPKKYDEILSTTYGDYLQMPPTENRGGWHDSHIWNPDVPYKETVSLIRNEDSSTS